MNEETLIHHNIRIIFGNGKVSQKTYDVMILNEQKEEKDYDKLLTYGRC